MKLEKLYLSLFTVYITIKFSNSSRILCLFPAPVKSHLIIENSIANELANRGHNVTIVTSIPINIQKNIEHILIDLPQYDKKFKDIVRSLSLNSKFRMLFISFQMFEFFSEFSAAIVEDWRMQKILNEREYDLLILGYFFNNLHFGVGAHYKCPVVIVWVNQPISAINNLVGNPSEISYVPSLFAQLTAPLSFMGRLINTSVYLFEMVRDNYCFYKSRKLYYKLFPVEKNYPTYDEILKNISLVLTASHFSDTVIRPNVPNLIEIGGIQVRGIPKNLPQKLNEFLDQANHGAILLSLGTNVNSSELDSIVTSKIFQILSKLPQKIIWKWESDNVPGYSENILYEKWLPQDDILSHPNIRAFISHGGLGGIAEARYHGVPIIGLPIFGDQPNNLEAIQLAGWAVVIDLKEFSEVKFSNALNEILHKPQYRQTIQKISKIYKDRPISAMETAIFWIEYVIRHHGAPHIQSPALYMNSIAYHSIDVILFYIAIIYIIYTILKFIIKFIIKITKRTLKIKTN